MSLRPAMGKESKAAVMVLWVIMAVAGFCAESLAQVAGGYGDYQDWQAWANVRRGANAGLASSYDRSGANLDFSQYEDTSGVVTDARTVTAATIDGPGIIYRFWMPHLTANLDFAVRMYFDGEATPRIDSDSLGILRGTFGYFSSPFVTTFAGGQVCYEPIPFQSSVRIETENKPLPNHPAWNSNRHYYQYSYLTFPPGTDVGAYTGSLAGPAADARTAVAAMFNSAGQHPAGSSATAVRLTTAASVIPAGETLTLADLSGPGIIRQISVRMDGAGDAELDGLRLQVRYDGSPTPAIDASIADFFGCGHQRALYRSLPLGTDSADGFYCYWPMPFHRRVQVELLNAAAAPIAVDSAVVEYESGPLAWQAGYLHAQVNNTLRASGQVYHPMLSAVGRGHYVGNLLYIQQSDYYFTVLEGDEIITVDGSRTLYGTGLEDAYNGGYYYNWVGVQAGEPEGPQPHSAFRPLCGILHVNHDQATPIARADQYRWLIGDRVPFNSSIEVKIENQYGVVGVSFTSVAFWYQLPLSPADQDGDGDVDMQDFGHAQTCLTGSGPGDLPAGCENADLDHDGDVDEGDLITVRQCLVGADTDADPTCGVQ